VRREGGWRRVVLAWGILVLWLGTVGWQVRREYFQPELARLAEAAVAGLGAEAHFYRMSLDDRTIGLASSRLDTIPGGFLLEDRLSLELPALGQTGTASAVTRVTLSPALQTRSFDFFLDSQGGRFEASGVIEGDTLLRVTVTSAGTQRETTFRLAEAPVFASVVPIRVALTQGLKVGTRLDLPVFDPSTLSTRKVEVEVLGRETLVVADSAAADPATGVWRAAGFDTIPVWHLAERFGGVQVESWIDDGGRVVRSSSVMGFAMERTVFELVDQESEAALGDGRGTAPDLILNTAIASNVDLGTATDHAELRFVLKGVDLDGFELDGGRQQLRGDTLVIRRESLGALVPGYTLPYPSMDLREALQPEPLIQSDDPRIQAEARRAIGRVWRPDPTEIAVRLNRWVHQKLAKTVAFSIPSAVAVLEAGAGDCNEHTVLFVALARAQGLPARIAVGLVYLDGVFFYHAWPEVWLGEWVAMDPTFGEAPASAAHLRFVTGGLAQQVEIVRLLGRLRIEVVPPTSPPFRAGDA
jgi:hypothetical protein